MIKIYTIASPGSHGVNLAKLCTTLAAEVKAEREVRQKKHLFLVVNGDVFATNRLLSSVKQGQFDKQVIGSIAELFNEKQRFFVLGNHDFDYGGQALISLLKENKFTVLASNAEFSARASFQVNESFVFQERRNKVTFYGWMTPETLQQPQAAQYIRTIREPTARMEQEGRSIIFSHRGLEDDKRQVRKFNTAQLYIVGGHSHEPSIVSVKPKGRHDGAPIGTVVDAGFNGQQYAVTTVTTESITTVLRDCLQAKPASEITAIIAAYEKYLERSRHVSSGYYSQPVCSVSDDSPDPSGLELTRAEAKVARGHLRMTSSVLLSQLADLLSWQQKAIAFLPAALIRDNIRRGQTVTRREAEELLFQGDGARVVTFNASGKEILQAVSLGASNLHWRGRALLLHPSHQVKYGYDLNAAPYGITFLNVYGEPIALEKVYPVVTTAWVGQKCFPGNMDYAVQQDTSLVKLFIEGMQGKKLHEQFFARIVPTQNLQQQEAMLSNHGRSAAVELKAQSDFSPSKTLEIERMQKNRRYVQVTLFAMFIGWRKAPLAQWMGLFAALSLLKDLKNELPPQSRFYFELSKHLLFKAAQRFFMQESALHAESVRVPGGR